MRLLGFGGAKNSKSDAGKTRRRAAKTVRGPSAPRRALIGTLIVAAFVALAGGPVWAWKAGWLHRSADWTARAVAEASAHLGLVVDQVYLDGRIHTPHGSVMTAVGVARGTPILGVRLDEMKARIERISWVKSAKVERRLPATLHITIEERRPIALWQSDKKLALVDREGVVVATDGIEKFRDLVVVVGKEAPRHVDSLFAILASDAGLAQKVRAAVWVGNRRWNVQFQSGLDVKLPEQDPDAAWQRLARFDRLHGLLAQKVGTIDLRLPDRMIIRSDGQNLILSETGDKRT